jgi:Putative cyclase
VVIDIRAQAVADRDYRLTLQDLRAWEEKHGAVPAGGIVLLRTGWGERWPDRKRYLGDDRPGWAWTPRIDHGPSKDFIVHQIATAANVPDLENVANLGRTAADRRLGDRPAHEDRRGLLWSGANCGAGTGSVRRLKADIPQRATPGKWGAAHGVEADFRAASSGDRELYYEEGGTFLNS